MYPVRTTGAGGRPIHKLATEAEYAQGIPDYVEPPARVKPERDPIADYEARKIIDAKYAKADPGAAKAATEAFETAAEVERVATTLKSHPGVRGAFGIIDAATPTVFQSTADAEVLRDSLMSLLTLENTDKLKGVLSDADMKVLRQASTTLGTRMSDEAAANELDRLVAVAQKAKQVIATAPPTTGSISVQPGGMSALPLRRPVPGRPGVVAESTDGGKTWKVATVR
jgi:hypothetical protein